MFQRGGGRQPRGFGLGSFAIRKPMGSTGGGTVGWGRKLKTEEEYFNESDSDGEGGRGCREEGAGSEEDDPLDAFMADIDSEIKRQEEQSNSSCSKTKAIRDDIEEEDDQETYFKAVANAPIVVAEGEEELEVDYDSDGNPIMPERAKVIDPLPPIDHSAVDYPSFERNFHQEHPDITALTSREVAELRSKLGIKVAGFSFPKPCVSFAHFGFEEELMALIRRSEFSQPTPIQAQAIPAALSGRDVIGMAKTGSGKTVAYLWPLLVHCMDQPELQEGDGPIGLILAPTRELCQQIYHEARKFGRAYDLTVCCVYGGGSKWEQSKAVKEGCEILVATPGRLIDLVRGKATNLQRVTFLVMDEADRMFDMGFEVQVRSIANHVRPDRQTLLFSATFRKKIERLCRDSLMDPIRVVVGDVGEANTDITQIVEVMRGDGEKWQWILRHLVEFTSAGSVLVFVTRKTNSEEVASSLKGEGYQVGLLHGDMTQGERDSILSSFKKKELPILVATDVAARGLDIPSIRTVINFDVARDIDTHVHRIGRTGRAGEKGTAFTLLTAKDVHFAGSLVRNLETAGQRVPDELMALAMQNTWFRKIRSKHGRQGSQRAGGGGAHRKERPGLGATPGAGGGRARRKERPGLGATPGTHSHPPSAMPTATPPAVGPMGANMGPGSDRTSVLKETLQSQYRMHFHSASSRSLSSTSSVKATPLPSKTTPTSQQYPPPSYQHNPRPSSPLQCDTQPPPPKKRKSRWD